MIVRDCRLQFVKLSCFLQNLGLLTLNRCSGTTQKSYKFLHAAFASVVTNEFNCINEAGYIYGILVVSTPTRAEMPEKELGLKLLLTLPKAALLKYSLKSKKESQRKV